MDEMNPSVVHQESDTDQEQQSDADLLYSNESLLPQVDWDNLEKQLKQAQIERERYEKVSMFFYSICSCVVNRKGGEKARKENLSERSQLFSFLAK